MKVRLIGIALPILLVSCTDRESKTSENILLADEVKVTFVQELSHSSQPSEWLYGLDREALIEDVYSAVLDDGATVYSSDRFLVLDKVISTEEVSEALNQFDTNNVMDQMQQMLFNETWYAPANMKSFRKVVNFYSPVRVWTSPEGETFKRLEFYAKPSEAVQGEMIANSVFFEFEMMQYDGFLPLLMGMDPLKFRRNLMEGIKSGKLTVYDPVYMVDKTRKPFTYKELHEFIGSGINWEDLTNDIQSVIFEENWYFDKESLNITKEVLSMGLVRKFYDTEKQQMETKILCFLLFD